MGESGGTCMTSFGGCLEVTLYLLKAGSYIIPGMGACTSHVIRSVCRPVL